MGLFAGMRLPMLLMTAAALGGAHEARSWDDATSDTTTPTSPSSAIITHEAKRVPAITTSSPP
jgi:hypothetical protein